MSRIGRLPISLPEGVTVSITDGQAVVRGAKGELHLGIHPRVQVTVEDKLVTVRVTDPEYKKDRALWGLSRVLLNNMVIGVTKGYEKKLEINGVGYKAEAKGKEVHLALGFSHPVVFPLPEGISATVEKNVITISGIDKQLVGEIAAKIRRLKKPEPYKGKGIKYADEVIRRKAGKVVKAAGAK